MFSEKTKGKMTNETSSHQNIIAQDTKIVGDIISKGPFRIDGQVEGNIKTKEKTRVQIAVKLKDSRTKFYQHYFIQCFNLGSSNQSKWECRA